MATHLVACGSQLLQGQHGQQEALVIGKGICAAHPQSGRAQASPACLLSWAARLWLRLSHSPLLKLHEHKSLDRCGARISLQEVWPCTEQWHLTKGCAKLLLHSLVSEVVGSSHELIEASSEVQGRAGQVATSLAGEESVSLHSHDIHLTSCVQVNAGDRECTGTSAYLLRSAWKFSHRNHVDRQVLLAWEPHQHTRVALMCWQFLINKQTNKPSGMSMAL